MSIATLVRGWFGVYRRAVNELELVGIDDPPKLRYGVKAEYVERNLGMDSFGTVREDGTHDEHATAGGQLSEDHLAGRYAISTRARGEESVKERFVIDEHSAVFNVDVIAPNLTGGGVFPKTVALRSRANDKFLCVDMAQRDANGDPKIVANRDAAGLWEMFDVIIVE